MKSISNTQEWRGPAGGLGEKILEKDFLEKKASTVSGPKEKMGNFESFMVKWQY